MEACLSRGLADSQGGPIRCDIGTNQRVFALPARPLTSEETAHLDLSATEVRVLLGGWLERQGHARFCTAAEAQTQSTTERSTACIATEVPIETATAASGPVIELDVYPNAGGNKCAAKDSTAALTPTPASPSFNALWAGHRESRRLRRNSDGLSLGIFVDAS